MKFFRTILSISLLLTVIVVPATAQDDEVINVETKLVTVPVIANKRDGSYLPDLRQEEFAIEEDGAEQKIAFFASVKEPFHVVLMLDTSASTEGKIGQIRRAATEFVAQLQPADKVKLISFDDVVNDAGNFTTDRAAVNTRIAAIRPGRGTKLYDAVALAIRSLKPIEGRKVIVIFTDGVDSYSDDASYDQNRRAIEESGIIIYPIRFDTRRETEQLLREQARNGGGGAGQSIDLATILGGGTPQPRDSTPTTFPGGSSLPPTPTTRPNGTARPTIGGIAIPDIILQPRRRDDRYPDDRRRYPDDRRGGTGGADDPYPSRSDTSGRYPGSSPEEEMITRLLDRLYKTADAYLEEISRQSGGRLLRANTLGNLPEAFSQIALELHTQYSLGYYPANTARDGKYRKIKVRTTRKNVAVRARPGYRAPRG